jgi:hypothetical protein
MNSRHCSIGWCSASAVHPDGIIVFGEHDVTPSQSGFRGAVKLVIVVYGAGGPNERKSPASSRLTFLATLAVRFKL